MDRNRYKRIAVRAAAGIGLLFTLTALLFFNELRRTRSEMSAVLADLVHEVLHNVPNFDSGRGFQIVIMREAQLPGARPGEKNRARWSLLFDENLRFPQASLVTRSSFLLANAVPTEIRKLDLHLPRGAESVILSNSELDHMSPREFFQRFPDNQTWDRFSISQPGFNFSKTETIVYVNHYCGSLCGGGGYILMRKVDGIWRIVDEHSRWMS
jgi:hypothetical protein